MLRGCGASELIPRTLYLCGLCCMSSQMLYSGNVKGSHIPLPRFMLPGARKFVSVALAYGCVWRGGRESDERGAMEERVRGAAGRRTSGKGQEGRKRGEGLKGGREGEGGGGREGGRMFSYVFSRHDTAAVHGTKYTRAHPHTSTPTYPHIHPRAPTHTHTHTHNRRCRPQRSYRQTNSDQRQGPDTAPFRRFYSLLFV